jgi:hypothetical protein
VTPDEVALAIPWHKIERRIVRDQNGCWRYGGTLNEKGYAQFTVNLGGKNYTAKLHRVAWKKFVGPIPDGLQVDHLCRVRHCLNPRHFELVTTQENTRRGVVARKAQRLNQIQSLHPRSDEQQVAS